MDIIRVVFISIPTEEATSFARGMVEERLAACVNLIPRIRSFYWWEEKIQSDEESLLVIKTTQQKIERLIDYVKEHHPCEVPEIITIPVAEGLPDYVNWIIDEVGKA